MESAKLYSFDLFDTLLARRTKTPSGVFVLMQKSLQDNFAIELPHDLKMNFAQRRIAAEREARLSSPFHEIRFEEIYACLAERFSLKNEVAQILMRKEIATERAVLYPITENIVLFRKRKQEARVAIVSDMYYAADTLRDFLKDADAELFADVPIYVSADWRATKAGGRLFNVVMLKGKVRWGEMEHFGDNRHSDYDIPRMLDIPAIHYKRALPSLISSEVRNPKISRYSLTELALGCQYALMEYGALETSFQNERDKRLYMAGAQVAGPLLWAFAYWLLNASRDMGHKRLYFLSRDGQILMKIADIMIERWGWDIETRYLYSSRVSWLFASMQDFGESDLAWIFQPLPYLNMKMLAERLHLSVERFGDIFLKKSTEFSDMNLLDWTNPLSENDIAKLKILVLNNKDSLLSQIGEERSLLESYLRQEGVLDTETIALADVGWLCRSQDALAKVFQTLGVASRIDGFYMGCLRDVKQGPRNKKYGMFAFPDDECFCRVRDGDFKKFICFIESMLEGDHGHVEGYAQGISSVTAVLQENVNIQASHWGLEMFQRGICDFARDFSKVVSSADVLPSRNELDDLCFEAFANYVNPTKEFASVLGDFPYAWDPSHAHTQKLAGELSIIDWFSWVVSDFTEQCRITYWMAGSLARSSWGVKALDGVLRFVSRGNDLLQSIPAFKKCPQPVRQKPKMVLLFPFCSDTPQSRSCLELAESLSLRNSLIVFTGPALDQTLRPGFERLGHVWFLMEDRSKRERRSKTHRMRFLQQILTDPEITVLGAGSSDFYKLLLSPKTNGRFWEILPDCYNVYNARIVEKLSGSIVFHQEAVEDMRQVWRVNGRKPIYDEKIHKVSSVHEILPLLGL